MIRLASLLQDSDKDSLLADIVERFAPKGLQGQALKFAEAIANPELKAKAIAQIARFVSS